MSTGIRRSEGGHTSSAALCGQPRHSPMERSFTHKPSFSVGFQKASHVQYNPSRFLVSLPLFCPCLTLLLARVPRWCSTAYTTQRSYTARNYSSAWEGVFLDS